MQGLQQQENQVYPKSCPACHVATSYVYRIEEKEGKTATWYRCHCGVIFQENFPSHSGYNKEYATQYAGMKEGNSKLIHSARTYANLIEELTYGRTMLDVGYCVPHNMDYFKERGWITSGIDINPSIGGAGSLHRGDFTNYGFDIPAKTPELKELAGADSFRREFDLIWMNHSFEHFNHPIEVLKKAHSLLSETGVLFIACPDADFINKLGVPGYPHWKMDEHYTLWTKQALVRELERIGFNVVMARRNFSSRYSSWYDLHIIAQRNYF